MLSDNFCSVAPDSLPGPTDLLSLAFLGSLLHRPTSLHLFAPHGTHALFFLSLRVFLVEYSCLLLGKSQEKFKRCLNPFWFCSWSCGCSTNGFIAHSTSSWYSRAVCGLWLSVDHVIVPLCWDQAVPGVDSWSFVCSWHLLQVLPGLNSREQ